MSEEKGSLKAICPSGPMPPIKRSASCLGYHLLVVGTFCLKIGSIAVEDVDVFLRTVDMVEEIVCHKGVVALWMRFWKSYVFVHIEGEYVFERYLASLDSLDDFGIHTQR